MNWLETLIAMLGTPVEVLQQNDALPASGLEVSEEFGVTSRTFICLPLSWNQCEIVFIIGSVPMMSAQLEDLLPREVMVSQDPPIRLAPDEPSC
jgi:hypothetical protein